jgi:hypothetical protein
MALQQTRTDDLNGQPEAQTTIITINGHGVEVDLAEASMEKLRKALEPFWKVGSPGEYAVTRQMRGGSKRKSNGERGYDLYELRAWAERNNIQVPQRGRMPQAIVDQYLRSP